jgi:hypothetical protein
MLKKIKITGLPLVASIIMFACCISVTKASAQVYDNRPGGGTIGFPPPPPPPPPPPVCFTCVLPPPPPPCISCLLAPSIDAQVDLSNYLDTFRVVIAFDPSAPDPAPHPELPLRALPPIAQAYWVSDSPDERMRRLRTRLAELVARANYAGLHLLSIFTSMNVEDPEPDSNAEDESRELRDLQGQIKEVVAQIGSLRTELQMRPLPVPDEAQVVEHTGNYSVIASGTSPRASYVNRNPADTPAQESRGTHTEVDYHFVTVPVKAGFAPDGSPTLKEDRELVRVEKEVPNN